MTREEAIRELKILKENYWDDDGYGHETKQYDDTMSALDMAIKALEQDAIHIPEGATNGEVVKTMFPDELLTSITSTLWWGDNMSFNKNWWNAPYKKGME